MKTSEVLNRAADLIEERGWTSGAGWPGDSTVEGQRLCLEGGIMAALGISLDTRDRGPFGGVWACPAYQAVGSYLGLNTSVTVTRTLGFVDIADPKQPLYRWNDEYDRTAAEVIEVLRACAVIEQAREEQDAAWATYAGLVTA